MAYYILKIIITTALVILIAEISKRSSFLGAILASVPLVSVLAMTWLYIDTNSVEKVSALSGSIFWFVIPSLVLFILLPVLLKAGVSFYLSMFLSISATVGSYWMMITVLNQLGIKL